jgi:hypothetical protein
MNVNYTTGIHTLRKESVLLSYVFLKSHSFKTISRHISDHIMLPTVAIAIYSYA